MKNYLCNFASGDIYKNAQRFQKEQLSYYYEKIFEYNDDWLLNEQKNFYEENKYVFLNSDSGRGHCIWKPLIILETLAQVNDGDIVTYLDVADVIYNADFFPWVEDNVLNKLDSRFFIINYYKHSEWTTRDCFIGMGCDTEYYWNQRQLEAGTLAFQKNEFNLYFLNEWLGWCKQPSIMCKNQNYFNVPNLPGFVDHRTDQSILTNLFYKYKFEGEYMENARAYILYSHLDKDVVKHIYK